MGEFRDEVMGGAQGLIRCRCWSRFLGEQRGRAGWFWSSCRSGRGPGWRGRSRFGGG